MYKYETHLHTAPVSRCGRVSVKDNLNFYKQKGYDGIFITNHFIDGNINNDEFKTYNEAIEFYFSDYENAVEYGKEIGLKVFLGVELSFLGTDFLVYGLDKKWFLTHPEILEMKKSEQLKFMAENGALVIQAHPFREAAYIDHIRLFPRCVHGVEVINGCRTDFENKMADLYAESYQLLKFAGSDNHFGEGIGILAGICCAEPIENELDFITKVKAGKTELFVHKND